MLTEYARDSVRRLRVVGLPGDALATRRSMERMLAGVELTPRGLSPSAIVCLRRLRAERGRDDSGRWVQAIQGQIAGMVARGARPFREVVPADATAVIFEDEAELLACLARDWREARGTTWWWTGLLGRPPSDELLRRVFLENPRCVPAAIGILVEAGRAIEFVRALPDAVCSQLQQLVSITFGVPVPQDQSSKENGAGDQPTPHGTPPSGPPQSPEATIRAVRLASVPGDLSVLSSAQRHFLAVGLLVSRSPVLARTAGIVSALQSAVRSVAVNGDLEPGPSDVRLGPINVPSAPAETEPMPTREEREVDRGSSAVPTLANASVAEPLAPDRVQRVEPSGMPDDVMPAATCEVPQDDDTRAELFDTSFAGIFYLVNLAIQLEIYGDFTQPARSHPDIPLERFLLRTAQRVCGDAVRHDPIWPALARLDRTDVESMSVGDVSPADRTIDDLEPDLERLAARALDMPEGAALEFLCRTPGRVQIGRTQIDVFFPLASHPIAIRMAGLDRNPGWVPVAGRVITFHYVLTERHLI